jgi:hypothetical protein
MGVWILAAVDTEKYKCGDWLEYSLKLAVGQARV